MGATVDGVAHACCFHLSIVKRVGHHRPEAAETT